MWRFTCQPLVTGYQLRPAHVYELEMKTPSGAPANCTTTVRRKRLNTDNITPTDFSDYLSHCLGVDVHYEPIRVTLFKSVGDGEWRVVVTGRIRG